MTREAPNSGHAIPVDYGPVPKEKPQSQNSERRRPLPCFIQEQRSITFKAVAQTAGISTAWLYEHERHQSPYHPPARCNRFPKRRKRSRHGNKHSPASKDTMIVALQKRCDKQAAEIEQLKQQVEVAYGLLYMQRKES